jgi:hypothetical protein
MTTKGVIVVNDHVIGKCHRPKITEAMIIANQTAILFSIILPL